jgi:hypothetical protein
MYALAKLSPFNSIAQRRLSRLIGTHYPCRFRRLYLNHLVYLPPLHTVNKPGGRLQRGESDTPLRNRKMRDVQKLIVEIITIARFFW